MSKSMQDCAVLFGDSLTQLQEVPGSLHERMSKAYSRKLDILNRGYGGYNTRWGRVLVNEIFAKKEEKNVPVIRLVTIWFGTNDAALPPLPNHVPLDEFVPNLEYILNSLTSESSPYGVAGTPGTNIVLITPAPILLSMTPPDRQIPGRVRSAKAYRDAVLMVGEKFKAKEKADGNWKLGVIDLWGAMIQAAGGEGEELRPYLTDGVHLNTPGYQVLWDKYMQLIKTEFKGRGIDPEDENDLPHRIPWREQIDLARPESVIELMALPRIRQG